MRKKQRELACRFLLFFVVAALQLSPAPLAAAANHFYVAPSGRPGGDGSKERPWDLATALAQPGVVRPGDTIWLHGGTYVGSFISNLTGAPGAPITVRQYPGERAILNGDYPLIVNGSWATYWGFEVMTSDPVRVTDIPGPAPPIVRGGTVGISIGGPNTKFINMIVHDTGQAGFFVGDAQNVEMYGNIIFFTGHKGPDHGWGHGIYAKNNTGTRRLLDNILFQNFGWGIHEYGETGAFLNNIETEGNISFNNGELAGTFYANILIGGYGVVAQNPQVLSNYTYFPGTGGEGDNNLGYTTGCANAVVQNNYFAGGTALKLVNCVNTVLTGNTFYGRLSGFTPGQFPNNTYYPARPTGIRIFIRPNQYEPGRAHIAVYNWDLWGAVTVDVGGILQIGARYEVRNVQDYFGPPVLTGTYDGRPLQLRMTGLRVAAPVGNAPIKPSTTGPEFAAFVLIGR